MDRKHCTDEEDRYVVSVVVDARFEMVRVARLGCQQPVT
jgi:hypothetical protein